MHVVSHSSSPVRSLTTQYVLALSSITLLAILGQILVQIMLQQSISDANRVNLAGRERVLSQKLGKAEESTFLADIDKIVNQYQREAEDRVTRLEQVEYTLLAVMLGALILEGVFLFRPAVCRIQRTIAELTKAKQQSIVAYEEQQRLNQIKDQIILNVNHELRTLMTSVYGYLELLRDHSGQLDMATQITFFDRAIDGCEEFQVHINEVLSALKIGNNAKPLKIEPLRVAKVVETVLDLFSPQKKQMYGIDLAVADTLAVWADQHYLYQIIRNLLSNAFKYSTAGTTITISASLLQASAGAESFVCIAIKDEGPGIPPADIPLLFNRFMRLKRDLDSDVQGTGLGLYICKQLVEAMRGHIWVESSGVPGQGSRFCFTLPAVSPGATRRLRDASYVTTISM